MKKILFFLANLLPMQHPIRQKLRRLYIKQKSSRQEIDQRIARENLKDVVETLNQLQFSAWWLEAGTCLGAIREKRFIPHDSDIDIGIMAIDVAKSEALGDALIAKGFSANSANNGGTPEYGYEISFIRNGINVDFFFFYEDGDTLWHGAWSSAGIHKHVFTKSLFEELLQIEFLGLHVFVPNPAEQYLEERYGDWQTPKYDWDWKVDPLCVKK